VSRKIHKALCIFASLLTANLYRAMNFQAIVLAIALTVASAQPFRIALWGDLVRWLLLVMCDQLFGEHDVSPVFSNWLMIPDSTNPLAVPRHQRRRVQRQ
jgi:hypothetical protein